MTLTSDLTRELASCTYEITVAGALGPVLRAAMQPLVATASGHSTALRASLRCRGDVADLLAALDARGLEVTHVAVRRSTPPPGAAARRDEGVLHPSRVTRARPRGRGVMRWPYTSR